MSAVTDEHDLQRLLRSEPERIEARLAGADPPPDDFNWLGLAEVAAARALRQDPQPLDALLPWARVAQLAYRRLIARAGSVAEADRYEESLMRLQAGLIRRHGHRAGDPFLDCDQIFDWFLGRHAGGFDAAQGDSRRWRELPVARIHELRTIKNHLGVIRLLERCDRFGTPEIRRWLDLRDQLP
jgi:hypothetical protein